ncbi:hypothetical protein I6G66_16150 [Delftia acidovorans]|uniref:Uncharacterized protein n=1 Tax=Delftia acidovorans TaxID=80866 RepID=A0A7T2RZ70_DELAC|nr:hypothetical protein [Delftia acidovorans]QPS05859.1 hypothetical protein I6G66_16150 [Delftia acidovorans]
MLSYNILFGGGAPLRSRPIYAGADRRVPSFVTAQIRPFKLRPRTNPAAIVPYSIAYNGAVYMLVPPRPPGYPPFPLEYYTTTDMVTLTLRSYGNVQFSRVTALGSVLFAEGKQSGGIDRVYRSTDNGASWPTAWDGAKTVQVAGGKAFAAFGRSDAAMTVYNPDTNVWDTRGLPEVPNGTWMGVVHNGTMYCVASQARAAVSVDGVTWSISAGFPAVAAALPVAVSRLYTFGGKFIAVGFSGRSILAMVSTDGQTWVQTAASALNTTASARTIAGLSFLGVELDGVLYIGVAYNEGDNKYTQSLLSTADGKDWLAFAYTVDPSSTYSIVPEPFLRPGTNTIMLGSTLIETDETGQELFYEL